jgi:hypothetical protein
VPTATKKGFYDIVISFESETMMPPINQDCYESVSRLLGGMPDAYIMEVTLQETGHSRKILPMKFVDSEKMTKCVSIGCDKNDRRIEKHITYKFPLDIKRVSAEFDGGDKVSFKYMMLPRYERQWSCFGSYLLGQTVSINPSVGIGIHCASHFSSFLEVL